jgi:histidyl-tRNA synthetase
MKQIIPSLKGTRDFYPEEMAVRTWLYNTLREVSESFGYQEYEAPFLETLSLYAAKSGEELVKEQSYVFPDRGGDLITLRPELTPSLARMIAQRQRQLVYPLRWWSWGPFWRYERPQKGRTREFFQWNLDLIGVDTPEADAETVAVIATFFQKVGLTPNEVVIRVNSRKLMDAQLEELGIPSEARPQVSLLIDRRDKMTPDEWDQYVLEGFLNRGQLEALKEKLGNRELWKKSDELVRFFKAAEAIGLGDYIEFDANTIRGLAYYTGTVFEAMDITGDVRRSILGGGRYDRLMQDVGGDPLPAVGFAMGDVVISLILNKLGLLPKNAGLSPAQVLVTVFDEDSLPASFALAGELRQAGLKVATYPEAARLQKQFKYTDRMGIPLAVVLGPNELDTGMVAIKDLKTGDQQSLPRENAARVIADMLENRAASC